MIRFFATLNARHITARQDFRCCQSCGADSICEEAAEDDIGYCFYHAQDTDAAADSGTLYLAWCPYEGYRYGPVANTILEVARGCGIRVMWDGTPGQRIALLDLDKGYFAERIARNATGGGVEVAE